MKFIKEIADESSLTEDFNRINEIFDSYLMETQSDIDFIVEKIFGTLNPKDISDVVSSGIRKSRPVQAIKKMAQTMGLKATDPKFKQINNIFTKAEKSGQYNELVPYLNKIREIYRKNPKLGAHMGTMVAAALQNNQTKYQVINIAKNVVERNYKTATDAMQKGAGDIKAPSHLSPPAQKIFQKVVSVKNPNTLKNVLALLIKIAKTKRPAPVERKRPKGPIDTLTAQDYRKMGGN